MPKNRSLPSTSLERRGCPH